MLIGKADPWKCVTSIPQPLMTAAKPFEKTISHMFSLLFESFCAQSFTGVTGPQLLPFQVKHSGLGLKDVWEQYKTPGKVARTIMNSGLGGRGQ